MSENQKEPVRYARYQTQVVSQPVLENGVWKRDSEGNYLTLKKTITRGYDSLLRKWVIVDTKEEILIPSECGMLSHAKLKVVFKRKALNDLLEPIFKFFVVECSVDFKDTNKHEFVTISNGQFWYHNLSRTTIGLLSFSSNFVKKGKPKPISEKEVRRMLKNREIANVYEDENLREICLYYQIAKGA